MRFPRWVCSFPVPANSIYVPTPAEIERSSGRMCMRYPPHRTPRPVLALTVSAGACLNWTALFLLDIIHHTLPLRLSSLCCLFLSGLAFTFKHPGVFPLIYYVIRSALRLWNARPHLT
ncbi:hypothetical protein HYPSUDRAFT_295763 [Hypholoma sublateritium FD-334 SS-4]|uniref:Uncharacterized protein n=1 Tax=Hypholoma sublateritium (strain FD-334 SS-4) TaxID=945553 RepID=A0A0D2LZL4_HYPSF|nr:hypothetical protein HYPSUDRAFT_295763 [Hypholoma sublateritium FD-334 SS-4]